MYLTDVQNRKVPKQPQSSQKFFSKLSKVPISTSKAPKSTSQMFQKYLIKVPGVSNQSSQKFLQSAQKYLTKVFKNTSKVPQKYLTNSSKSISPKLQKLPNQIPKSTEGNG